MNRTSSIYGVNNLLIKDIYTSNLTADNRGALRELEGLEKLVDFVGNKVIKVTFYSSYTLMRLLYTCI